MSEGKDPTLQETPSAEVRSNPQGGTRLLARNVVINFLGLAAPVLVAFVTIPPLVHRLGPDRFGILTVAWVLVGYFSVFDFGLGRALTKLVAERIGTAREGEIASLAWTSLLLMFALGLVGGAVLASTAPWLAGHVLKMPAHLRGETLTSLYLLALSIPLVIVTAGFRGLLEANQSFGYVNAIRIPMSILSYVGPLLVLHLSSSLVAVCLVLALSRLFGLFAHIAACFRVLPLLRQWPRPQWKGIGAVTRFGGWITVSNLVSPLMDYMDRFLIGGIVSMAAVAYYVTPYELVSKIWLIPGALMGVLFPALSASFARDREQTRQLSSRALRVVFIFVFPLLLGLVTLAPEILSWWLGNDFSSRSTRVLQWLGLGMLINSLAQVPFAMVQGMGRPDITGKLHLAELPLYGAAILFFAGRMGIDGVAVAWVLRVTVDAALLFLLTRKMFVLPRALWTCAFGMASVLLLGVGALVPMAAPAKAGFLIAAIAGFSGAVWRALLTEPERDAILRRSLLLAGHPVRPVPNQGEF